MRACRLGLMVLTLVFLAPVASAGIAEPTTLRVATLAPKNSAWGKMFQKWERLIRKKTDGQVRLKIYFNAVQGDEGAMVGKMRSGQLDGASLSSVGLSAIYKPVMVLQLPGVLDTWAALDRAREGLKPEIDQGFGKQGFQVVAWGDIGRVRQMSKGFGIHTPSDMRGKSPVTWREEPMAPMVYSVIGGVTPVPLSAPEVLPALRAGKVNVVNAPPLAAEQLQWTPYLDHINSETMVCAIGGTVFRKSTLDALAPDVKATFARLQRRMAKRSSTRIRKLDQQAYERLRKKMTVVTLSASQKAEWASVLRTAVARLAQGTYPKAMIAKAVRLAGKWPELPRTAP